MSVDRFRTAEETYEEMVRRAQQTAPTQLAPPPGEQPDLGQVWRNFLNEKVAPSIGAGLGRAWEITPDPIKQFYIQPAMHLLDTGMREVTRPIGGMTHYEWARVAALAERGDPGAQLLWQIGRAGNTAKNLFEEKMNYDPTARQRVAAGFGQGTYDPGFFDPVGRASVPETRDRIIAAYEAERRAHRERSAAGMNPLQAYESGLDPARAAWTAAYENDPLDEFLAEVTTDPLSWTGSGAVQNLARQGTVQTAKVAGVGARTALRAGDTVATTMQVMDRVQALPITGPFLAGRAAARTPAGRWVTERALGVSPKSGWAQAKSTVQTAVENDMATGDTNPITRLRDVSYQTAKNAPDPAVTMATWTPYEVYRAWDVATKANDAPLAALAAQDLTRRKLMRTVRGKVQLSTRLVFHAQIDDVLQAHSFGDVDTERLHNLADAFVFAAYKNNPAKYNGTLANVYPTLKFYAVPQIAGAPEATGAFKPRYGISIAGGANLTTLPHELAHWFQWQASPGTQQTILNDLGQATLTPAGQEQIAEGIENFLMDVPLNQVTRPEANYALAQYRATVDASYLRGRRPGELQAPTQQEVLDAFNGITARTGATAAPPVTPPVPATGAAAASPVAPAAPGAVGAPAATGPAASVPGAAAAPRIPTPPVPAVPPAIPAPAGAAAPPMPGAAAAAATERPYKTIWDNGKRRWVRWYTDTDETVDVPQPVADPSTRTMYQLPPGMKPPEEPGTPKIVITNSAELNTFLDTHYQAANADISPEEAFKQAPESIAASGTQQVWIKTSVPDVGSGTTVGDVAVAGTEHDLVYLGVFSPPGGAFDEKYHVYEVVPKSETGSAMPTNVAPGDVPYAAYNPAVLAQAADESDWQWVDGEGWVVDGEPLEPPAPKAVPPPAAPPSAITPPTMSPQDQAILDSFALPMQTNKTLWLHSLDWYEDIAPKYTDAIGLSADKLAADGYTQVESSHALLGAGTEPLGGTFYTLELDHVEDGMYIYNVVPVATYQNPPKLGSALNTGEFHDLVDKYPTPPNANGIYQLSVPDAVADGLTGFTTQKLMWDQLIQSSIEWGNYTPSVSPVGDGTNVVVTFQPNAATVPPNIGIPYPPVQTNAAPFGLYTSPNAVVQPTYQPGDHAPTVAGQIAKNDPNPLVLTSMDDLMAVKDVLDISLNDQIPLSGLNSLGHMSITLPPGGPSVSAVLQQLDTSAASGGSMYLSYSPGVLGNPVTHIGWLANPVAPAAPTHIASYQPSAQLPTPLQAAPFSLTQDYPDVFNAFTKASNIPDLDTMVHLTPDDVNAWLSMYTGVSDVPGEPRISVSKVLQAGHGMLEMGDKEAFNDLINRLLIDDPNIRVTFGTWGNPDVFESYVAIIHGKDINGSAIVDEHMIFYPEGTLVPDAAAPQTVIPFPTAAAAMPTIGQASPGTPVALSALPTYLTHAYPKVFTGTALYPDPNATVHLPPSELDTWVQLYPGAGVVPEDPRISVAKVLDAGYGIIETDDHTALINLVDRFVIDDPNVSVTWGMWFDTYVAIIHGKGYDFASANGMFTSDGMKTLDAAGDEVFVPPSPAALPSPGSWNQTPPLSLTYPDVFIGNSGFPTTSSQVNVAADDTFFISDMIGNYPSSTQPGTISVSKMLKDGKIGWITTDTEDQMYEVVNALTNDDPNITVMYGMRKPFDSDVSTGVIYMTQKGGVDPTTISGYTEHGMKEMAGFGWTQTPPTPPPHPSVLEAAAKLDAMAAQPPPPPVIGALPPPQSATQAAMAAMGLPPGWLDINSAEDIAWLHTAHANDDGLIDPLKLHAWLSAQGKAGLKFPDEDLMYEFQNLVDMTPDGWISEAVYDTDGTVNFNYKPAGADDIDEMVTSIKQQPSPAGLSLDYTDLTYATDAPKYAGAPDPYTGEDTYSVAKLMADGITKITFPGADGVDQLYSLHGDLQDIPPGVQKISFIDHEPPLIEFVKQVDDDVDEASALAPLASVGMQSQVPWIHGATQQPVLAITLHTIDDLAKVSNFHSNEYTVNAAALTPSSGYGLVIIPTNLWGQNVLINTGELSYLGDAAGNSYFKVGQMNNATWLDDFDALEKYVKNLDQVATGTIIPFYEDKIVKITTDDDLHKWMKQDDDIIDLFIIDEDALYNAGYEAVAIPIEIEVTVQGTPGAANKLHKVAYDATHEYFLIDTAEDPILDSDMATYLKNKVEGPTTALPDEVDPVLWMSGDAAFDTLSLKYPSSDGFSASLEKMYAAGIRQIKVEEMNADHLSPLFDGEPGWSLQDTGVTGGWVNFDIVPSHAYMAANDLDNVLTVNGVSKPKLNIYVTKMDDLLSYTHNGKVQVAELLKDGWTGIELGPTMEPHDIHHLMVYQDSGVSGKWTMGDPSILEFEPQALPASVVLQNAIPMPKAAAAPKAEPVLWISGPVHVEALIQKYPSSLDGATPLNMSLQKMYDAGVRKIQVDDLGHDDVLGSFHDAPGWNLALVQDGPTQFEYDIVPPTWYLPPMPGEPKAAGAAVAAAAKPPPPPPPPAMEIKNFADARAVLNEDGKVDLEALIRQHPNLNVAQNVHDHWTKRGLFVNPHAKVSTHPVTMANGTKGVRYGTPTPLASSTVAHLQTEADVDALLKKHHDQGFFDAVQVFNKYTKVYVNDDVIGYFRSKLPKMGSDLWTAAESLDAETGLGVWTKNQLISQAIAEHGDTLRGVGYTRGGMPQTPFGISAEVDDAAAKAQYAAHEELSQHQVITLTPNEANALVAVHRGIDYEAIKKWQRDGVASPHLGWSEARLREVEPHIASAYAKAPRLRENITVFRGDKQEEFDQALMDWYLRTQGEPLIVERPAFTSTAYQSGVSESYARRKQASAGTRALLFRIEVPAGIKAWAVNNLRVPDGTPTAGGVTSGTMPLGTYGEMEYSFPPGAKFVIEPSRANIRHRTDQTEVVLRMLDPESDEYRHATGGVVYQSNVPLVAKGYVTPPQVSTTPPLSAATPQEVVDVVAGDLRATPQQADAAGSMLQRLTSAVPVFNYDLLWSPQLPYRQHVERMIQATTNAERTAALRELGTSMNADFQVAGALLPGVVRWAASLLLPSSTLNVGGTVGRSRNMSPLPDNHAQILNEVFARPEVIAWKQKFDAAKTAVEALAAAKGFTLTDMTPIRDVLTFEKTLTPDEKKIIKAWLDAGGFVDPVTGHARQVYSSGVAQVWGEAVKKEYGVKDDYVPSEFLRGLAKGMKSFKSNWVAQAVATVANLLNNATDFAVKSIPDGINPMIGESAWTFGKQLGIIPPTAVYDPRSVMRGAGMSLDEMRTSDSRLFVERIPGYGNWIRYHQMLSHTMESSARLSAWVHGIRQELDRGFDGFLGEASRQGNAALAEMLAKVGPLVSADEVMRLAGQAGLAPNAVARLRDLRHRNILEASKKGEDLANKVHFNVLDERNIEAWLHMRSIIPFHLWSTRNLAFYTATMAQHPWMLRTWMRYKEMTEEERERGGLTARFADKLPIGVSDPLLATLFGPNTIYFNPMMAMSVTAQLRDIPEDRDATPIGKALQTANRYGLSLFPWFQIPLQALQVFGPDDEPGNVARLTGVINPALSLGATALAGRPTSLDIEAPIRAAVRGVQRGVPPISETRVGDIPVGGSRLIDYLVSKKLEDLSLETMGVPNHPDYIVAMADPTDPLYQQAYGQVQWDMLQQQGRGLFVSGVATLPDTEAAARYRAAQLRPALDALSPEDRRLANAALAKSGDLSTAYWSASSDPRILQINAGLARGRDISRTPFSRIQDIDNQRKFVEYARYRQWLEGLPDAVQERSPAAYVRANP